MSIRTLCDEAAERARDLKTMQVADATGSPERPSMRPVVQGWRGTDPVVLMTPKDVDRDQGLSAAKAAALGFGCDALAFSFDAWSVKGNLGAKRNPVTGKDWQQGDMQRLVEDHDGLAKGWITESLGTYVVNRAGDLASTHQAFTVESKTSALGITSWQITWGEVLTGGSDDAPLRIEGVVPNALLRFMREPTVIQHLDSLGIHAHDFDLDSVETLAHMDCGAVRALRLSGWEGGLLLLGGDDPRRHAIIKRSLGAWIMREDDE